MKNKMSTPFLLLLLHLLQTPTFGHGDCPSPSDKGLTCYSDYSHNITCIWKSSSVPDQKNNACLINAERFKWLGQPYGPEEKNRFASCKLQSFDKASPALKRCSLIFSRPFIFMSFSVVALNMSCSPSNQNKIIFYKPACNIKVNPPPKPEVNVTAVSWFSDVHEDTRISEFSSQLQWKQKEQQWSDLQIKNTSCTWKCMAQLDQDLLLKGETYEARVRVLALMPNKGTWSDWSPTASWVSSVGKTRSGSGKDVAVLNWSILGLALFGVLLLPGAFFTAYKSSCSRIYIMKKMTGPPLPDPAKSAQLQTWLNPHFPSESYQSFLESMKIVSVEVTSAVDAVILCKPDVKMIPEDNKYDSSCASFSSISNPNYSGLCSSPAFPVTAGSLEHCVSNNNGRVHKEEKNEKQDGDVAEKELELVKMLLKGRINGEAVVVSDYRKNDKLQAELQRFHSFDSGISNYEEVSRESMEADDINRPDEGIPCKEEKWQGNNEGNRIKSNIQKLFEDSGRILDKNSILSPYKQIPTTQAENAELLRLQSVDSGMSSNEEVSQDSMEEDSVYMAEGEDEGALSKERRQKDFQKVFGGIFGQNSPQGVSGYKQIPIMQAEICELSSPDSETSRIDEDSLEDSMGEEDKTTEGTCFWFPPLLPTPFPSPIVSLSQQPLDTFRSNLGLVSPPLQRNDLLKQIIRMSDSVARQPSDNGYRPVRQKQSKEWES